MGYKDLSIENLLLTYKAKIFSLDITSNYGDTDVEDELEREIKLIESEIIERATKA